MLGKVLRRKSQSWKELAAEIEQAKKDPEFMKEIDTFIKVTTS